MPGCRLPGCAFGGADADQLFQLDEHDRVTELPDG
jgi:hypothetical protein